MTRLRLYRPGDRGDVYDICVRTGDSGADATGKFWDDTLLPDVYAGPYLALEPGLAFVVDTGRRVSGYLLAAQDTRDFVARYRAEWLPGFAARHPLVEPPVTPDDRLTRIGHHPEGMVGPDQERYPAHLHIDLLPEVQRQGWGRRLMRALFAELRGRGVPGVQLGFGERNTGAGLFYRRLGFHPLSSAPGDPYTLALETDVEP